MLLLAAFAASRHVPAKARARAARMLILHTVIWEHWLTAPSPSQDRCGAASLPGSCSKGALMQNDFWKQLLTVSLLSWAWKLTGRVLFFCFVPETHQLTVPFPDRSGTCFLETKQEQIFRFELVSAMKSSVASYLLTAKKITSAVPPMPAVKSCMQ